MSQAGKLREIITLYTPAAPVADGAGGWLPAAAETSTTAYAQVRQMQAKEDLVNGKITYRQPYRITLRANQVDLTNLSRIEWKEVKLSIVSVTTDERNTETNLIGYANR